MLRFLVLGFLVAGALGASLQPVPLLARDRIRNGKIVGGEEASITDAPYQAAMLYSPVGILYSLSCGGSIIREDVVVCASHCPSGTLASMWRIRAGSNNYNSGGQTSDVVQTVRHPYFDPTTIDNDIALFILETPFTFDGETIAPIPLPQQDEEVEDGAMGLVTGWGATYIGGGSNNPLRKVTIPIVNQQRCVDAYTGINAVTRHMICAGFFEEGGQDACQGDSGGPLAVDGVLIGVTSWGLECARPGFPGVWTRVPFYVDWININLPEIEEKKKM